MSKLHEGPARDEDGDGIHYGQSVINFFGYWVASIFTLIIVWVLCLITYQMRYPPASEGQNYLSENVQLIGYVVSALIGSITTLLAVFAGKKAMDMMKATSEQRKADQKIMEANRKSVYEEKAEEMTLVDSLNENI